MEITPAAQEDIPQLCELLEILFLQESEFRPDCAVQAAGLEQILASPQRGQILLLRDGTRIVGMVNLLFTVSTALGGRVAILEDMIVRPGHRGHGAGSELLRAAIELAKSVGCRRLTLLTDRTNASAQKFYLRHGFSPSKMVPYRLVLRG